MEDQHHLLDVLLLKGNLILNCSSLSVLGGKEAEHISLLTLQIFHLSLEGENASIAISLSSGLLLHHDRVMVVQGYGALVLELHALLLPK